MATTTLIGIDYAHLAVGETTRSEPCPSCGKSGSFAVTRNAEGLVFVCHRAKCGIRGFVTSRASLAEFRPRERRAEQKQPEVDLVPLPPEAEEFIRGRFGIDTSHLMWDNLRDRVAYPTLDERGYETGHVLRHYPELADSPSNGRKALYIRGAGYEGPACSWHGMHHEDDTLVLVEDIVSARKVAQRYRALALLGTYLSPEVMGAIARTKTRRVLICLDPDALRQSVQILRQVRVMTETARIVQLPADPKDMAPEQLWTYLSQSQCYAR